MHGDLTTEPSLDPPDEETEPPCAMCDGAECDCPRCLECEETYAPEDHWARGICWSCGHRAMVMAQVRKLYYGGAP